MSMEKEILRVLKKCEEMKWITINKDLEPKALARVFVELLKDMKLRDYLDMFTPIKDF